MHARVATLEGGDPQRVRQMAAEIKERAGSGPPMYEVGVKIDAPGR